MITLREHDPNDRITKIAPVNYDPGAKGPAWEAHLRRFLPNENVRRQVQRDLGVSLVGVTLEEMLPIWYGTGANGKSTTARVIQRVLGDYAGVAAPGLLIQSKYDRHPTELADLAGLRIVFASEVGQGKHLDEELVKRLTGGDVKKGRFMRQDFFSFPQTFTVFMLVNHHPIITGVDHAIWRRVRLIPWTVQIPEAERLPQDVIVDRLFEEGPAILNWLLAGLQDWQKDRHWLAPEVRAATSTYRAEQDRLGAFLAERCEEAPHYTAPVAELYESYTAWAKEAGEEPLGKTAFGNRLREGGKSTKKTGHDNVSTWLGVRLKRDLRTHANLSSCSPLETDSMLEEHETKFATVRNGDCTPENDVGGSSEADYWQEHDPDGKEAGEVGLF